MPLIVFGIKSYFFSRIHRYKLRQKPYIFDFLLIFYRKIKKLICAILAIVNKDLKIYLGNLNLLTKKNTIWLEFLAKKRETGKETTDILYYKYKKSIS